jgi:hypothetical protein
MSNAGPLTNILDCYPKAQTFLPDSADRLKTICISPVDCPQELAYPEAMQLLANPSLSLCDSLINVSECSVAHLHSLVRALNTYLAHPPPTYQINAFASSSRC